MMIPPCSRDDSKKMALYLILEQIIHSCFCFWRSVSGGEENSCDVRNI